MSLTQSFLDDPMGFLGSYIIVVQDDSQGVPDPAPVDFFLTPANTKNANNNFVFLVRCTAMRKAPDAVIPAYWLPWKKGEATVLTLGDGARFMFTSEMTNCRFSVLTGDMAKPTVSHVEGTKGASNRDEFEVTAGLPSRKDDTEKKMRRLSVSGIKNPTKDALDKETPKHLYAGQDGAKKSSAFVFGHRKETTWKFYAQVVEGVMAGTGMDALKAAKDRVVPLNEAYEIA